MVGIEEKLDKLPVKPGVYIMKNEKEEIIYVGKAISLRNRVRQYFQPGNNQGLKVKNMVKNIDDFEYIIVDNEVEALILEANLIKKHKPKYNILLRDDKQYPYIKVTLNEKFPRVVKTREVKKDKAKYYGPYPSATAVNDFLEIIHNIYPIRTCKLNLNNEENIGKLRPCLNYFINRCKAPCQGFIEEDEYNVMISEIMKFLAGNKDDLIDKIQRKMTQASKDLEFEKAASYRDQLISLNLLQEEQKIVSTSLKDQDVIGLARGIEEVCIQIFFIRAGKIVGREHFLLEDSYGSERGEILSSFIKQFYMGSAYIPKEIIIDTNINDFETVEAWLSDKKESKVEITVPQRGDKVKLVEMVNKNARDMLDKYGDKFLKKHRENIKALEEIQYTLGLENLPKRIEAYDISNISGMQAVGSMVVFENGALQVEGTINGIGERAGNVALEEVAVALKVRGDFYPYETTINLS
ncbi:MAG TPA: excinuclease ABC subunit UvrC, partial [Tissierellaceae bacterium]